MELVGLVSVFSLTRLPLLTPIVYKGSAGGSGLQQELQKAPSLGGSSTSQNVYIAARLYNSGDYSYNTGDNLSNPPDGTASYSSDIADRLIGYVF